MDLIEFLNVRMDKDFRTTNDLMNWVIFGNDTHFYNTTTKPTL